MSKDVVIKAENVSKLYRLGQVGTGTLSHDLKRWWAMARGKEDPYMKIGAQNDRTQKATMDYAWAVRDVNFEVNRGDTLGIIGKNGAGKSTLLKLLSRVTTPTTGSIKMKGRIASLLEVGTGFHPELTGRENIYMNGAILGMTRKEITSKFDEIVDFSGVQMYIDTPVKRYSSGMYVRLAFGVAAHLEPEILIVDEVLAVGDAEFQKKCLGKMKDVSEQGRTVLFVSHNMGAIRSLCTKGLLMTNGQMEFMGDIDTIVTRYMKNQLAKSRIDFAPEDKNVSNDHVSISSIEILNNAGDGMFNITENLPIRIAGINHKMNKPVNFNLFINSDEGVNIFATCSMPQEINNGRFEAVVTIPANFLNDNGYFADLMVVENGSLVRLHCKDILMIEGKEPQREEGWQGKFPGLVRPNFEWQIKF
jgi:lipopolysaccharide transport system ATP-binding protein